MNKMWMNSPVMNEEPGLDGGGEGGGGQAPASNDSGADSRAGAQPTGSETFDDAGQDEGQQPEQKPAASAPQGLNLTPEQLQGLVQKSFELAQQSAQPRQQQAAPKQMTDEEFNKFYGIPTVDAAFYEQVFGMKPERPEQVAALSAFAQGLLKSAVKMSTHFFQNRIGQMQEEYKPLVGRVRQMDEEASEARFFTKYPDLKDPGLKPLLLSIRDAARARKMQFPSEEKAFEFLATQAKSILQNVRGNAIPQGGGSAPAAGAAPTQQQRKMTPTNLGGHSSHGRGTPGTPQGLSKVLAESHDVFN